MLYLQEIRIELHFSVFEYKITSIRKNNNKNRNLYNNFLKEKV